MNRTPPVRGCVARCIKVNSDITAQARTMFSTSIDSWILFGECNKHIFSALVNKMEDVIVVVENGFHDGFHDIFARNQI